MEEVISTIHLVRVAWCIPWHFRTGKILHQSWETSHYKIKTLFEINTVASNFQVRFDVLSTSTLTGTHLYPLVKRSNYSCASCSRTQVPWQGFEPSLRWLTTRTYQWSYVHLVHRIWASKCKYLTAAFDQRFINLSVNNTPLLWLHLGTHGRPQVMETSFSEAPLSRE